MPTVLPEERQEDRETLNLAEYLWMIRRGKWVILTCVVLSLVTSIYVTMRTHPVYRASATFIYDLATNMSQTFDMGGFYWFEVEPARNNQIQLIGSRSMAEAVADSVLRSPDSDSLVTLLFDGAVPEGPALRGSLIRMVQGHTSVTVMKDTDFFVLSATGPSPVASATLANLMVHVYYRRNLEQARGESREIRQFLEEQLEIIEVQLEGDEEVLREFKESNGLVALDEETRQLIGTLSSFESQAAMAATAARAAGARREYLLAELGQLRTDLVEDLERAGSSYTDLIEEQLASLEMSRADLVERGVPASDPVFVEIDSRIESYREALSRELAELTLVEYPDNPSAAIGALASRLAEAEAEVRSERVRESALMAEVAVLEGSLSGLPEAEMTLARLERNMSVSENIYLLMRTKYEETRISEAGQIGNVTIVDTALAGGMIKPDKKRNTMMGLVIGLALGLGIVVLRERLDTSVKNPEAIESLGIGVLGAIPRIRRQGGLVRGVLAAGGDPEGLRNTLVTRDHPMDAASEAYRDLRTSILFARAGEPLRSVLVTSAGPREGKSTTAANLAVTMAQAGQRCLLIDADLRRPVLHRFFGTEREPGVSELIAGLTEPGKVLRDSGVENLWLLPCGAIPHNPSELLGSRSMNESILERFGSEFELMIFDTPPAAVVTDALVLSSSVDGTIVVIDSRLSNKRTVKSAWIRLERTARQLLGAVLNQFDPLKVYTSHDYYAYRYHHYYDEEGPRKRSKR
ncbi:polysaccharide biosynthesis tyrosine autokinase [Candidatus Fermentibacterales bacterium]|nr:polysaccharide biosynthesis tyrosine autokinase [Candidatus Fermentibacterales bacterium]